MNILDYFIPEREAEVDQDFLDFELERTTQEEKLLIKAALERQIYFETNPHNSIILYVTGLTNQFSFDRERCDTIGGSPPDVDLDFSAKGREKVEEWIIEEWGRENVSKIGTHMTFGIKGLTRRFFKLSRPDDDSLIPAHYALQREIEDMIPEAISGFEPTLREMVEGNKDKGYHPQTFLRTNPRYQKWYNFVRAIEGMIEKAGVHAAGLVISDFPINEVVPLYKTSKFDRVTQWNKDEVENHGLIKFDLLVIRNLDILQECTRLIKKRHNVHIDIYDIEDGDKKAYDLMGKGRLTGIFQFEESDTIKKATVRAQPRSVGELSDISSLVRPGPAQAGYLDMYLDQLQDDELPNALRELWSATRGVLVYQEQLQQMFAEFCGYDLVQADTIRRIIGKKKPEKLAKLEPEVKRLLQDVGKFTPAQADRVWEVVVGCGSYLFNKSHGVCYSYLSYVCAYLKANYPIEFFCALMTERSATMQPKDWAAKATEFVQEAREMGIKVLPPSIQKSALGFTIVSDDEIYFGLNGIRSVGQTAARSILQARKNTEFVDIMDFAFRVNRSKVNTKHLESLIRAGAFDTMGYQREELLENVSAIYDYFKDLADYEHRLVENKARELKNESIVPLIEKRNALRRIHKLKRERDLTLEELDFVEEHKTLRVLRPLKVKDKPTPPVLSRDKLVKVSFDEILIQQEYIGCFLGTHPAPLVYPDAMPLNEAYAGLQYSYSGFVLEAREFKTRKGNRSMGVYEIGDGTATAKIVVFPKSFAMMRDKPKERDVIRVFGKVKTTDPMIEIFADRIKIFRS